MRNSQMLKTTAHPRRPAFRVSRGDDEHDVSLLTHQALDTWKR